MSQNSSPVPGKSLRTHAGDDWGTSPAVSPHTRHLSLPSAASAASRGMHLNVHLSPLICSSYNSFQQAHGSWTGPYLQCRLPLGNCNTHIRLVDTAPRILNPGKMAKGPQKVMKQRLHSFIKSLFGHGP